MKDNTLLLIGATVVAFFLLSKKGEGSIGGSSEGAIGSYGVNNPFLQENTITQQKFNAPVQNVDAVSLDLSPTSFTAENRFTGVTYDKGQTIGVLDRAAQQSITVQEAQKRANSPFIQATPTWQSKLKNYNKNVGA